MSAVLVSAQVKVTQEKEKVRVEIDGKPFTDFVLESGTAMKPYLYPLRSVSGKLVTRHYPMEIVPGEPKDHQHQRGLWFAHDRVNGNDFWNNESDYKTPNRGRIVVEKITDAKSGKDEGIIAANLRWDDLAGNQLVRETRQMIFRKHPTMRIIDFDIKLTALTKVTFGDSKDGTFGIRLAVPLQEENKEGPHTGTLTNAAGLQTEKNVWGKPSDYMDYSGELEGEKLGVTIFDHPSNSRRAHWHVRAYGLFSANPFGRKTFDRTVAEDVTVLEPGGQLHFRYRLIIHPGDAKTAGLQKIWEEYSKK